MTETSSNNQTAGENPQSARQENTNENESLHFNGEQFLEVCITRLQQFWLQVRRVAAFIMYELGGYELFDAIALWCVRNPHIAICCLAACLVLLLPFLIIFGFGVATMIVTFTGILMLEGTLLTIVSMMFFACLGGLGVVLVVFAVVGVAAYFGFVQIYDLYGGMERHKAALTKFAEKQRQNYRRMVQQNNIFHAANSTERPNTDLPKFPEQDHQNCRRLVQQNMADTTNTTDA